MGKQAELLNQRCGMHGFAGAECDLLWWHQDDHESIDRYGNTVASWPAPRCADVHQAVSCRLPQGHFGNHDCLADGKPGVYTWRPKMPKTPGSTILRLNVDAMPEQARTQWSMHGVSYVNTENGWPIAEVGPYSPDMLAITRHIVTVASPEVVLAIAEVLEAVSMSGRVSVYEAVKDLEEALYRSQGRMTT